MKESERSLHSKPGYGQAEAVAYRLGVSLHSDEHLHQVAVRFAIGSYVPVPEQKLNIAQVGRTLGAARWN